jgi:hypothetical protein
MSLIAKFRNSQFFRLLGDISVVYWVITIVPGLLSGAAALIHGKTTEIVILYFVVTCACILVILHYGELLWHKNRQQQLIPIVPRHFQHKYWRLSIPLSALILLLIWAAYERKLPQPVPQPPPQSEPNEQNQPPPPQQSTDTKLPPTLQKKLPILEQGAKKRQKPQATPQTPTVSAPNGIAIGGDNLGSATVTNTFGDTYPRPGVIPQVNFCISDSTPAGPDYETLITIRTDQEISAPFWGLFFDGPITGATLAIDGIQEPFGSSSGHPFASGARLDPLGTLPVNSRLFLRDDAAGTVPDPDNIFRVQITEIGNPFGGPYRPWGPKDKLRVTVKSKQPVHILAITSGYGREFLSEQMLIRCTQ